jgi:trans-2,3-dihydro-3-hydroxyanthranilate isomerase
VKRRVTYLDVFTELPLAGNGLAVVEDADGVSEGVMLAFAAETRLSETTYLQTAANREADYRNRIWTPEEELPFAGHPSLGTAVAFTRWRGEATARLVQETAAGVQPLEVRREAESPERWSASMQQAQTEFGPELDRSEAMAAVGLDEAAAHTEIPPRIVSTGVPHALVPLADSASLAHPTPDYPAIDALLGPHDAVVLYLAAWQPPAGGRAAVHARAFSRVVSMAEDPATGSAAGPLCAYLHERGVCGAIDISQGVEMGRPSSIAAEIDDEGRARVSGSVVPIVDGEVELPG